MNKEFIPYEQALALKELGLSVSAFGYYYTLDGKNWSFAERSEFDRIDEDMNIGPNFTIIAPLYQQAFRWFREKHNLTANPSICSNGTWSAWIMSIPYNPEDGIMNDTDGFKTYEEAELACLNKLIELVKDNSINI